MCLCLWQNEVAAWSVLVGPDGGTLSVLHDLLCCTLHNITLCRRVLADLFLFLESSRCASVYKSSSSVNPNLNLNLNRLNRCLSVGRSAPWLLAEAV